MKILNGIHLRHFLFLTMIAVGFAACKKDDTPEVKIPAAGFMAFNLAPDQNAVVFSLSGNPVGNSSLGYNAYTGVYYPIYTGNREVRTYDFNTNNTLAIASGNFADSMYYSAFLIGANGNYRNVVVQDNLDSLTATAGKAYVRYINAIADSAAAPEVTLASASENDITATASFGTVSSFKQVNAGQLTATVSNGGNNLADRTITLEENKVYTLLLIGMPGSGDSTKTVQVKYIQNGTITP